MYGGYWSRTSFLLTRLAGFKLFRDDKTFGINLTLQELPETGLFFFPKVSVTGDKLPRETDVRAPKCRT